MYLTLIDAYIYSKKKKNKKIMLTFEKIRSQMYDQRKKTYIANLLHLDVPTTHLHISYPHCHTHLHAPQS